MPSIGQFLDLLEAVSRRDWRAVEEIGQRIAEEERVKKHYNASHKIVAALDVVKSSMDYNRIGTLSSPSTYPSSPPPELLQLLPTNENLITPVLESELQEQISEFFFEWQFEDKLSKNGLEPRRTILMYGPPGCGKTLLARHLANKLKLRLYVVRFDSLISSFLGETGQNIKKVFEFIYQNRCALLIDELDAIAKLRDDRNELGELKRVVISLLQNLDLGSSKSLLISATNHPHMLDPAIWRRFEITWKVSLPNAESRQTLFRKYIDKSMHQKVDQVLKEASEGLSGADIAQICRNALRRNLIDGTVSLDESLLVCLIEYLKRQVSEDGNIIADPNEKIINLAVFLKEVIPEKYSFNDLNKLSGVPKSTLHHRFKSIDQAS